MLAHVVSAICVAIDGFAHLALIIVAIKRRRHQSPCQAREGANCNLAARTDTPLVAQWRMQSQAGEETDMLSCTFRNVCF